MTTLWDALLNAFHLIAGLDGEVFAYAFRSIYVALGATCIASLLGVPAGVLIAEKNFRGKRGLVTVLNTMLGLPTVVVGLFAYSLISRQGPFGDAGLLFTVPGMMIGEVLLILPLVTALTVGVVVRVDRDVHKTAIALGATGGQALFVVLRESRFGILAAVIAGYGRVLGEVGVATILGGNVQGFTRTLTTAAVLHAEMGYFEMALALGIVLLALSFIVNIGLQLLQGGGRT